MNDRQGLESCQAAFRTIVKGPWAVALWRSSSGRTGPDRGPYPLKDADGRGVEIIRLSELIHEESLDGEMEPLPGPGEENEGGRSGGYLRNIQQRMSLSSGRGNP